MTVTSCEYVIIGDLVIRLFEDARCHSRFVKAIGLRYYCDTVDDI